MLGKKLKNLVQNSTHSNAYIAEYLGCSVNNLYNFYKKSSLDSDVITKSCELFNVPLSYFLGGIAENISIENTNDTKDEAKEINIWSKKYLEAQEKVNRLQDELSEFKNKFIAFQEKAFDKLSNSERNSELGKPKEHERAANLLYYKNNNFGFPLVPATT